MCKEFFNLMKGESKMSITKEFIVFLELQVKQTKDGIFINQAKYIKDPMKRFKMENAKVLSTHISPSNELDIDENNKLLEKK